MQATRPIMKMVSVLVTVTAVVALAWFSESPGLSRTVASQDEKKAVTIIAAAFVALKPSEVKTSAAVQVEIAAPLDKNVMEKFMTRKLAAAQRTLEGVAREDHELIQKATAEMIDLSRQAAWEKMASYRFVQDTTDFVAAAEFLSRMADAKDNDSHGK